MNIIREQVVEEITTARNSREDNSMFSKDASDQFGGIFISVGAVHDERAQVARRWCQSDALEVIKSSFVVFRAPGVTSLE
jgi:hypothetical protein